MSRGIYDTMLIDSEIEKLNSRGNVSSGVFLSATSVIIDSRNVAEGLE